MIFLRFILVVLLSTVGLQSIGHAQLNKEAKTKPSSSEESQIDKTPEIISLILKANYKAMEDKKSELVLSFYHPKTNLITSKEDLDGYFSQMDMSYSITNIRYIGNDGVNFVIVYHEVTEFRRKGNSKLEDKEDTDVLMVFRKHDGKLKIFTSKSLKPGP